MSWKKHANDVYIRSSINQDLILTLNCELRSKVSSKKHEPPIFGPRQSVSLWGIAAHAMPPNNYGLRE